MSRYQNFHGGKDKTKLKEGFRKMITIIGPAEISYLLAKFLSTYLIFEFVILDPSIISIITTIYAWISYVIVAYVIARREDLFN